MRVEQPPEDAVSFSRANLKGSTEPQVEQLLEFLALSELSLEVIGSHMSPCHVGIDIAHVTKGSMKISYAAAQINHN
jgi:hypothetical protein